MRKKSSNWNHFILIIFLLLGLYAKTQTYLGADYSVVTGGFQHGPSTEGIYGALSGKGSKIWFQQNVSKKRKIALEVQIFYNNVTGKPGYDIPERLYTISSFNMTPQETYGITLAAQFYILSDFLYLKYGYGLASSTNFSYSMTTQFSPEYTSSNVGSTEVREVESSRVWGSGFILGTGIIKKIYKRVYLKVEGDYNYFSFSPIVTYKIYNSIKGTNSKSQQEGFDLGFMNINLGIAIKL